MKRAIFYTIIFATVQIMTGMITMAVWRLATGEDPQKSVACSIVIMTIASLLTMGLFLWQKWAEVSPHWIRTRPWGVIFWCVLAALGLLLPSMWLQEQMPELPNVSEELFEGLMSIQWGYVVIGLMAPLAEELVFRGAVLRALLRWKENPWVGICISAALFALIHMNPAQMPHAFMIGLLLGWMYYRTDSIIPGVVYHWVNNSVAFAAGHILGSVYSNVENLKLHDLFGRNAWLAVVFSLLILLPALYQLNLRLKK
ncbi:MAG: CPBP family intramembrane metalloprotease [Prevotella sp.]|nr:CPBP family intramembrane metalloprotease [Prevotella sp.]